MGTVPPAVMLCRGTCERRNQARPPSKAQWAKELAYFVIARERQVCNRAKARNKGLPDRRDLYGSRSNQHQLGNRQLVWVR